MYNFWVSFFFLKKKKEYRSQKYLTKKYGHVYMFGIHCI